MTVVTSANCQLDGPQGHLGDSLGVPMGIILIVFTASRNSFFTMGATIPWVGDLGMSRTERRAVQWQAGICSSLFLQKQGEQLPQVPAQALLLGWTVIRTVS